MIFTSLEVYQIVYNNYISFDKVYFNCLPCDFIEN